MEQLEVYQQKGYSLDEPVAYDEWGTLYRATYLPHRRKVLLRDFAPSLSRDEGARELLLAEVGAWARLDHPGVLQALDWGDALGRCYCAAMWPEGIRLGDMLQEDGGVDGAGFIFSCLLAAVEAARKMGVLHLGLGPGNIWVGKSGRVQVAEFGLWYVASEYPALGIEGCEFPAPEQLCRGRASSATDVFSLGLIYVALRLGLEAARAAAHDREAPAELAEGWPIIERCLKRDPVLRLRSAGELSDEMAAACGRGDHPSDTCELCAIKEEMLRGASTGERYPPVDPEASHGRGTPAFAGAFPRILIAALVVLAVLVWWLALR